MPSWLSIGLAFAGAVGTVQGAAWLGASRSDPALEDRLHRRGAWLTPLGLLTLGLATLLGLVPDFFSGS